MNMPADRSAQTALQEVEEMARFREAMLEERRQQQQQQQQQASTQPQPLGRGAYKRFAVLLESQQ